MAQLFDYKALDPAGKQHKGIIEAENIKAARSKLKKQGLLVTDMKEKNTKNPGGATQMPFFGGRVSARELAMMTRQIASLVKANIPLVEALNAMVEQTENPKLKVVLSQVRQDVNEGLSLAKSTAKHPSVFDTIFINMIEAGESAGTLSLVMLKLADLKEAQMRLRNKVVSGMTYPMLMLVVAVVLMLAIFTFVIPKLATVFESMNKPMPPITRFLIGFSDILISYWYLFGAGAFIGIWLFLKWKISPSGRPKWDAFKLKAPIFGSLIRMIAVTRFASTMATLLSSGVPILAAMSIAKNLVDNIPLANAISNARENITEGQSIAEPLKRSGEFPPLMIHMISIGEKTGELPDMLRNVSATYEDQINARIDGLTSLLEPIMIVGMGGVVGFIVLSVFMPLMDIGSISR